MVSRLSDSNSTVESRELDRYFGEFSPAVAIRMIEKKPVVTQILDPTVSAAGLHVGDDNSSDTENVCRPYQVLSQLSLGIDCPGSFRDCRKAFPGRAKVSAARWSFLALIIAHAQTCFSGRDRVRCNWLGAPNLPSVFCQTISATRTSGGCLRSRSQACSKNSVTPALSFLSRGPIAPLVSEIASRLVKQPEVTTAIVTGPLARNPDLRCPESAPVPQAISLWRRFMAPGRHPTRKKP